MRGIHWVAPSPADDAAWATLLRDIELVDRRGEIHERADLADEWASVWSHPATDSTFVWDGRDLVAFGWLKTVPDQRGGARIECWGGVHPMHRRRGIGRALLAWQVKRAAEVAGELGTTPARIGLEAGGAQRDLLNLAERVGFEVERQFLELARTMADPVVPVAAPAGLSLRAWSEELDEPARLTHLEAFVDHWGMEPRTRDQWRQWYTGHRAFRPELSRLALERTTGDVAGVVLASVYPSDWEVGPREAWILTVATQPAWRRRGVAAWLLTGLLEVMAAAPERFERALLGVDSANHTGALHLYRSLGFTELRRTSRLSLHPRCL